MMSEAADLRVLIVEDNDNDALLLLRELERAGYAPQHRHVQNAEDLSEALDSQSWHIILSDYRMPRFDGLAALKIVQDKGLDIPFIIISGTIGEDVAVAAMRAGAHDYLMKGKLKRLGPAIERELGDARTRRQHRAGVDQIRHLNSVLSAIRRINQLIVHENDPRQLLQRACELLVETREYMGAWVALVDAEQRPTLMVGSGASWQEMSREADVPAIPRCGAAAMSEGTLVLLEEPIDECAGCPVRRGLGDHLALAAPLMGPGGVEGVVGVHIRPELVIDDTEKSLFLEVAEDLRFALGAMATEVDLQRQRALTDASIEAMTDIYLLWDPVTGRHIRWNAAMRELTGYSDEELGTLPAPDSFMPPEHVEYAMSMVETVLRQGSARLEFDLLTRDQRRIPMEATVSKVDLDAPGEPLFLIIGRDLSEPKLLQAQIAQSDRLASMGMLAAGVAHEINNPLSYVLFNLESVAEDLQPLTAALRKCLGIVLTGEGRDEWRSAMGSDQALLDPGVLEELRRRCQDALQGTRRIRDVAKGLGTFSRVEDETLVPVHLEQAIEVAINMVFNEIKYRARLVKDYGNIAPVMANDGKLSQVFLNLLINACHAIEEGHVSSNKIRLRTWQEGDEVFAEVKDTGRGISGEHLARLFEPFFTTKKKGRGTGLGLSISKSIVQRYGGRIEVTSTHGRGTSFIVCLPIRAADVAPTSTTPSTAAEEPVVRARILVIDDEAPVRAIIRRILRAHDVLEASSGLEAKRLIEDDGAFDLILCDMMMSAMSGAEFYQWLADARPALARRVVFVSGGAFTEATRRFLASIDNPSLDKPFDAPALREMVTLRLETLGVEPG